MKQEMIWSLFSGERVGADALLLADFAREAPGCLGADLGCGSGILMLLLLLGKDKRRMVGVDIRESAVISCRNNLQNFGLSDRGKAVLADYRDAPFAPDSLDFLVSNPPYFRAGSGAVSPDPERAVQRTESATVYELSFAAARYLKTGGHFYLVHRTNREAEITAALCAASFTPTRRCEIFSMPGKRAPVFLLECVKGMSRVKMQNESILLHNMDGTETDEYRKICHWEA